MDGKPEKSLADMITNNHRTKRRSSSLPHVFIGFCGTAAIVAIAGCSDGGKGTSSTSSASSTGGDGSGGMMQTGGMGGMGGKGATGSSSTSSGAGMGGVGGVGGVGGGGGVGGSGGMDCIPEICNGIDDDCDGVIDNGNPGGGMSCVTGLVGVCAAGTTKCGNGALTCEQNVMSSPEVVDGLDNDCNGMVDDGIALGKGLWAKGYGSDTSSQSGFRITTDSMGNIGFIGSMTGGNVNFGGPTMNVAGSADEFLVKLDPNGAFLWQQQFSAVNQLGHLNAIAFDKNSYVYTAGYFVSTMTVGGKSLTPIGGGGDIFILKHDVATGLVLWSKVIGEATDSQNVSDLTTTPAGNLVVTGTINGGVVNFGGGGLNGSYADTYLAMYDTAGNHIFSKRFGDASFQYGVSVSVNAASEILLASSIQGTVNFGGGVLTSAGSSDIGLAKFAADGTHLWSKLYGSASTQDVYRAIYDAQGNILLTGKHNDPIDFGCGAVSAPSNAGIFVAKLDANGACLWTKTYGTTPAQQFYSPNIAVDPSGNVIMTATFLGAVDFGGGTMTPVAASPDIFVLKLSATGAYLWSKQYGDPVVFETDNCAAVATDPMGNIVLTGDFGGNIDFGLGTISSGDLNTQDIFVAKISP